MKSIAAAILLTLAVAMPVSAAKHDKPFIRVVDGFNEAPGWARYPIDAIYGQGFTVQYSPAYTTARFTCRSESGKLLTKEVHWLVGEGNPGESPTQWLTYPYVPTTYAFCTAKLLGKNGHVVAKDTFVIYSPV